MSGNLSLMSMGVPICQSPATVYSSKEGAQEAHEAIRPSDVKLLPADISAVERDG